MKWETFRNDDTNMEIRLEQLPRESVKEFRKRGSALLEKGYRSTGTVDPSKINLNAKG